MPVGHSGVFRHIGLRRSACGSLERGVELQLRQAEPGALGGRAEHRGGQGWKASHNYDRWGNQWVDATNSSGINVYSVTPTGSAWITPKNRINLSAGSPRSAPAT
jgi:hypothetical protein